MTHSEIVNYIKANGYFRIEELVDKTTYTAHKDRAWKFFDPRLLITLVFIREQLGKPMTINNWLWGGQFSQRGLRTNISSIVKKKSDAFRLYLSAHLLGKGVDFDVKGMTASEVRKWLQEVSDELPYKIRLEYKFNKSGKEITWVHLDVFDEDQNPKVYLFNV